MKKEKMITRTITSTIANIKYFDMDKNEVKDDVTTLAGKLTENEIESEVKSMFEYDFRFGKAHNKFIVVNGWMYEEKLYGVTESAFLEIATELPPRKANETQEEE